VLVSDTGAGACVPVLTALTVMLLVVFLIATIRIVWEAVRNFALFIRLSIAVLLIPFISKAGERTS
jgi:hypothetical protein